MEFVGRACPLGACNLLEVPGLGSLDVDDEDGEVVIGIRPKSSPLPRRRSSASDEDSEPETPASGSRRVSFADAKGLSLVHVKEFEMWEIPNLPKYELCEGDGKDTEEYSLSFLNFSLPSSDEQLFIKVQDQKVVLESLELLPGTTIVKGVVRVLNVSFSKAVFVRTTLDSWSSHFDLLAEYMPGSSDGQMDCFWFKLTLVPPSGEQGTRVDFCVRYETPVGTFWANNHSGNYVLFCHREMKEQRGKAQRENVNKRSCLKFVSQNLTEENCSVEASSQENVSPVVSKPLEELNPVKGKRRSDGCSAAPPEDEPGSRAENRRSSGGRGQRTAAPLRGDGGADGAQRVQSPGQAAPGGDPVDTRSGTRPLVDESPAARNELDETSRAPSDASASGPESSENRNAEPEAGDISHTSSRSQNRFTSGSVVTPLYHQVFARVESDTQRAALTVIDITQTTEREECVDVTLNDSPAKGEDECLSVWSDPLQRPAEMVRSHHRCTASHEVPGPVYGDAAAHPHAGNMLNMESVNVQAPEESLCPQGEAQEDNMTFDLHWQAIAEAAQAELTEPCSQIKTDLDASVARTERQKVMTSAGVDEIVVKNNFTTRETSLGARVETHDAAERAHLESYVFEDEIILPADSEVGAEVAGSMTKADHTRGDTFVQFKDKPIIVPENIQHCEMKAAVAAVEAMSPAEPANWETTALVEEKETNMLTDEEKTETTGLKSEDAEAVGHLEDTASENKDPKETEKAPTGGEAAEREAEDADVLEDQQKAEESRRIVARTDRNAEATQIKTIIGENEPAEGGVTEKREDKRSNVQNKEEAEPEKQMEIELRGEAQAGALWDDGVKPWDYVGEMLVGAGEEGSGDPQGVTSESTDDGAGRCGERRAITQNEVEGGLSAPVNNTRGKDKEDPAAGQHAHMLPGTQDRSDDSASAGSDSDDELELYMHCLRAVHAGPPARGGRDAGKRPNAGKSKSRSTHMPSISEALDEEQHLSCLRDSGDPEEPDVRQQHVHEHVSRWEKTLSCSGVSKTLVYATSLVVFIVVAYHYDFLACFALYLASVLWLCCQGDTRTTRG